MSAFVDTNVLLYSISRDPGERRKQEIAVALLQRDDLALSVQVLQEFYVQATRRSRADAIAAAERAGCETLLSEDLNHSQKIGRVRIDNPFLE